MRLKKGSEGSALSFIMCSILLIICKSIKEVRKGMERGRQEHKGGNECRPRKVEDLCRGHMCSKEEVTGIK